MNSPKKTFDTVESVIRLLAYNNGTLFQNPLVEQDHKTITSLATSPYAWTEKQGKLAVFLLKKYAELLKSLNFGLEKLIDNPIFEQPFRTINFEKVIELYTTENGQQCLEIKFPYDEKIIKLIRCLKKKCQDLVPMLYDGETKKWTMNYTDISAYYITLIAVRYNFKIVNSSMLEDFEEIRKEKKSFKSPICEIKNGQIKLINAPESLQEHWNSYCKNLSYLKQRDQLKQFKIDIIDIDDKKPCTLAESIAFAKNTSLFIDRNKYDKEIFLKALIELDDIPAVCPVGGDLTAPEDVREMKEWLAAFKKVNILPEEIFFGFDFDYPTVFEGEEPKSELQKDREDLYKLSKINRKISHNTKILFVRNRIPKLLQNSNLRLKCAFMIQDFPYWPMTVQKLDLLVESLPKKLYYMSRAPLSGENEKIIKI